MPADGPRFSIDSIDVGADDLVPQLPRTGRLLRVVPGPDRPDYCLAVLDEALTHRTSLSVLESLGVDPAAADPRMIRVHEDGTVDLLVFGIVIAARMAGAQVHAGMRDFPVALAYVVDNTAMADELLDLHKVLYVAVAMVTDLGQPS